MAFFTARCRLDGRLPCLDGALCLDGAFPVELPYP